MKEMIYSTVRTVEVLDKGVVDGRKYYILSLGTHPTAYVQMTDKEVIESTDRNDYSDIDVHCGFTFCGTLQAANSSDVFLGWDYAHCCDYMPFLDEYGCGYPAKRWTTKEIFVEVCSVIRQLNERRKNFERDFIQRQASR